MEFVLEQILGAPSKAAGAALAVALIAQPAAAPAADDSGFLFDGSYRARYETLDPQFRAGLGDSDQVLAMQTSLRFRWHRDRLQAVVEIMDSRAGLNDEESYINATVVNTLEPIQSYVAWHGPSSMLRAGRMTMNLGKRRLLARSLYRNTVASFAGLDWSWQAADGRAARAFVLEPLQGLPTEVERLLDNEPELDRGLHHSRLAGLYYQLAPLADASLLEVYLLDYSLDPADSPALAASHVSFGARLYRNPAPNHWSYEAEAIAQRGRSRDPLAAVPGRDLRHDADSLHLEIGYSFNLRWRPTLVLQYDCASGDHDPNDDRDERFNPLFGSRRFDFGPTSIYGIAARSNIESPGVRLIFAPSGTWQGMLAYRSFRLAAARDAWIGSGYRDPSGAAGRSVGRQLEASFNWAAIPQRLDVELGAARLDTGRFVSETAGAAVRGDPTYAYAAITASF